MLLNIQETSEQRHAIPSDSLSLVEIQSGLELFTALSVRARAHLPAGRVRRPSVSGAFPLRDAGLNSKNPTPDMLGGIK